MTDVMTDTEQPDAQLVQFLMAECNHVAHDMAHHVGNQIFDVLKRNGMAQRSEAASTAMMVLASAQILEQAIDQCSKAAKANCRSEVSELFRRSLNPETLLALSLTADLERAKEALRPFAAIGEMANFAFAPALFQDADTIKKLPWRDGEEEVTITFGNVRHAASTLKDISHD